MEALICKKLIEVSSLATSVPAGWSLNLPVATSILWS
jgi:hypothetical protein